MTSPSAYLDREFRDDLRELEITRRLIGEVAQTFEPFVIDGQWPYELVDGKSPEPSKDYSQSTNSMILFALDATAGRVTPDCALVPRARSTRLRPGDLSGVRKRLVDQTRAQIEEARTDDDSHVTWSGSFGWDDPFTLAWLWELIRSDNLPANGIRPAVERRAKQRVKESWDGIGKNGSSGGMLTWQPRWGDLDALKEKKKSRSGFESLDHAFPVLRLLHLNEALGNDPVPASVWRYFHARLHEQLSQSDIPDAGFDTTELVFVLEGILRLDPASVGRSLLDRVFDVIGKGQAATPYWRAVKPFVATPQGLVLFSLSVETANSLLRSCDLVARHLNDPDCFSRHVGLFRRYAEWIRLRRKRGSVQDGRPYTGWHSEHVHMHGGVHLWETSQVLLFLAHYTGFLDRHVASRALTAANLEPRGPWPVPVAGTMKYWKDERRVVEPLLGFEGSDLQIYSFTGTQFLKPRESGSGQAPKFYSMLVFGPPGTGKTLFAKEICKALGWRLITVTPSDFICGGESEVEARAKMVFQVLRAQSEAVVLFDEIDRMVLDRDSQRYEGQSDIFQFMTPSMLTKLQDLRELERIIFLVGTNYPERIDPAVKRRGRLDARRLLPPPDWAARSKIVLDLIEPWWGRREPPLDRDGAGPKLDGVLKQTRLMTFKEIEEIFNDAVAGTTPEATVDELIEAMQATSANPAVRLASYERRFFGDEDGNAGGPRGDVAEELYTEFMVLVYLKLERDGCLDAAERDLLRKVIETRDEAELRNLLGADRAKAILTGAKRRRCGGR